jgi:hypothetical protein
LKSVLIIFNFASIVEKHLTGRHYCILIPVLEACKPALSYFLRIKFDKQRLWKRKANIKEKVLRCLQPVAGRLLMEHQQEAVHCSRRYQRHFGYY